MYVLYWNFPEIGSTNKKNVQTNNCQSMLTILKTIKNLKSTGKRVQAGY